MDGGIIDGRSIARKETVLARGMTPVIGRLTLPAEYHSILLVSLPRLSLHSAKDLVSKLLE